MPLTIDMSAGGNFTFNANTSIASDINIANNSMTALTISATAGPGATISYSGSPYCKSMNTPQAVTRTGTTGGTFSASPAGLSLDANSGAVTPSTSTAGSYTVTYTIAASGGCGAVNATATVIITAIPNATIQYTGSAYCSNTGTATVTRTGTAGGTFTATPAGLSINASTGDITLATSIAGTYTVNYTIPATGGCAVYHVATTVTINAFQNAGFNYGASNTFCQSAPNPSAIITGTSGGTFTSNPSGLVFTNTSTGQINLAASQLNSYTITYTTAGPCANSSSINILVTSAPSANFGYASPSYCKNGTNPSPVFGTASGGGVFSASPAGLAFISSASGQVDLANSNPGTYIVTNFIAASNGCAAATATSSITITAVPSATISYAGSPFCSSLATPQIVNLTGTSGGFYSSLPGLTINASTGSVTPATSTSGTYTVTYTVPPSGGCGVFTTTTPVTITPAPAATISYAGSPFCNSVAAAQPVTRTGNGGGVFSSSPAGLSLNAATGAVSPSASTPGVYTITYTIAAANGCGALTTTTNITITSSPAATISYTGTPFCADASPVAVNHTGTPGGNYSAASGLSLNAVTGQINISSSTTGTYTVTYTVPASGGCGVFSTTTQVVIRPLSIAPTGIGANVSASCGSNTLALSVQGGTLVTGASWNWYSGSCGGTALGTGATLANVPIATTTTYFVRAEGGSCSNPQCASTVVTVNEVPQISITSSSDTLLVPGSATTLTASINPAQAGNTIQWFKDGVLIPGATSSSYLVNVENLGTYIARVTTTATCTAVSNAIRINPKLETRVFIAPNPTKGKFKVRFYSAAQNFNFSRIIIIYDSRGSRIYYKDFPVTGAYSSMDVDISNQKKGIYYVKVRKSNGEELGSGKVIVQ